MSAIAAVVAYVLVTCGRCSGSGRYYCFGVCYGCQGRGKVRITTAEQARRRAHHDRMVAADAQREQARQASLDRIDWTGSRPCQYRDIGGHCTSGACSACIGGEVPDLVRNPHLRD